jgi:hypothetical protein
MAFGYDALFTLTIRRATRPAARPPQTETSPAMVDILDDSDALPPISADQPCGPDLDLEGDLDFMN